METRKQENKKTIEKLIIAVLILGLLASLNVNAVFAQQGILPEGPAAGDAVESCDDLRNELFTNEESFKRILQEAGDSGLDKQKFLRIVLGCAIKSGKIRLYMVPFYITFIVQFLLSVAGLIAVLFVVLGGYHYVVGGLTEDKEKGKKTIFNALTGLVIALSAWIIVNFIQVALTS